MSAGFGTTASLRSSKKVRETTRQSRNQILVFWECLMQRINKAPHTRKCAQENKKSTTSSTAQLIDATKLYVEIATRSTKNHKKNSSCLFVFSWPCEMRAGQQQITN